MKRVMTAALFFSLVSIGISGCSKTEKSSMKEETKIVAPGGTTTITTETDVKKTGEKPPGTTH